MKSKIKIISDKLERFSIEVTDLTGATSRTVTGKKVKFVRLDIAQAALKELEKIKSNEYRD